MDRKNIYIYQSEANNDMLKMVLGGKFRVYIQDNYYNISHSKFTIFSLWGLILIKIFSFICRRGTSQFPVLSDKGR